jgi:hypothetical protein
MPGKSGNGYFMETLRLGVLAYLVVLAINTPHVTIAKENSAGATTPRKHRFLPVMSAYRSHDREMTGVAGTHPTFEPFGMTFTRADITFRQPVFQSLGAEFQLSGMIQGNISRYVISHDVFS